MSQGNPFQSPQSSSGFPVGAVPSPRANRPGGLTAVCVIAIVLGALGLGGSLLGLGSLAAQSWLQKAFTMPRQPGVKNPALDAQLEMQEKTQAVAKRYLPYSLTFVLVNIVISGGMLIAGIMTLKMNPSARKMLMGVFLAAAVLVIVSAVVQLFMQLETAAVVSDSMSRMLEVGPAKGRPQAGEAAALKAITRVTVFIGLAFTLAWSLAQIIFYTMAAFYLRRPRIRELFCPGFRHGLE